MKNKYYIIGKTGQLSQEFQSYFANNKMPFAVISSTAASLSNRKQLREQLVGYHSIQDDNEFELSPVIINCGAYNDVDKAEVEQRKAFQINALGPKYLSEIANDCKAKLIHFSSDYVFKGAYDHEFDSSSRSFIEYDIPNPINYYGETKLQGENYIKDICHNYLILRTSWLYGKGTSNFIYKFLQYNKNIKSTAIPKMVGCPTYTYDLVKQTMLLLDNNVRGLYNCSCEGYCSKKDFSEAFCSMLNIDITIEENDYMLSFGAKRPQMLILENKQLDMEGLNIMRNWKDALYDFVEKNKKFLKENKCEEIYS